MGDFSIGSLVHWGDRTMAVRWCENCSQHRTSADNSCDYTSLDNNYCSQHTSADNCSCNYTSCDNSSRLHTSCSVA